MTNASNRQPAVQSDGNSDGSSAGPQLRSTKPWGRRVVDYLDRLEKSTTTIQAILDQAHVDTQKLEASVIGEQMSGLETAFKELESRLAEREQLLKAHDAPRGGLTLTERLQSGGNPVYQESARRCIELSERIQLAHERSISLFVCQHQLADFSAGTLRLMAGAESQQTFGMQGGRVSKGADHRCSGSLFDDAA